VGRSHDHFDIAPTSNIAGKTLEELRIQNQLERINIAFIKRGES
jgi:CPA2 family monovalent cation:H+ antiporter-2